MLLDMITFSELQGSDGIILLLKATSSYLAYVSHFFLWSSHLNCPISIFDMGF